MRLGQLQECAERLGTSVRKRILIVDANESNRERLVACLSGEYEVRSVACPADAEAIIRSFRPHLVVEQTDEAPGGATPAPGGCEGMAGSCDEMRAVFSMVRKAARTDVGVLLIGECGTGKEATARAIHRLSTRRSEPFVTLNAGALPAGRLEVEVFGRENGSSGALPGAFERAEGGTLFLDGVGCLPPGFQAGLLRFLKDGRYRRVDGRRSLEADVRLIAAAEAPLSAGTEGARLREKLFYTLGVVTLELPPLRERGEDIVIIAGTLLDRYSREHHRNVTGFTLGAVRAMMNHAWPGNVAEMEGRVRRAVIVARGRSVSAGALGLDGDSVAMDRTLHEAREEIEHTMVVRALRRSVGNVTRAARSIGVSRPTMYDLIRKHGLDPSGFKGR